MSIFSSIRDAIFGGPAVAAPLEAPVATPSTPAPAAGTATATKPTSAPTMTPPPASAPAVAKAAMTNVDVAAVLDKLEETSDDDDLDWRKSIVDLMKILKLDSSLKARKQLAQELKYTGDMGDSAKMNVWLHRQVMNKLAENGGVVPADLKD